MRIEHDLGEHARDEVDEHAHLARELPCCGYTTEIGGPLGVVQSASARTNLLIGATG